MRRANYLSMGRSSIALYTVLIKYTVLISCAPVLGQRVHSLLHRDNLDDAIELCVTESTDNVDLETLGEVAVAVLLREAQDHNASREVSEGALLELSVPYELAHAALRRIATQDHGTLRFRALRTLADRGDEAAVALLRAFFDAPDAEARAAAFATLEPNRFPEDQQRLRLALGQSETEARLAAQRLGITGIRDLAEHALVRAALLDLLARSTSAGVRRDALYALRQFEPPQHILEERLGDPDAQVRGVAVEVMVTTFGPSQASLEMGLAQPGSDTGVVYARALIRHRESSDEAKTRALAYLLQATEGTQTFCAQTAAVALLGLPARVRADNQTQLIERAMRAQEHSLRRLLFFAALPHDIAIAQLEGDLGSQATLESTQTAVELFEHSSRARAWIEERFQRDCLETSAPAPICGTLVATIASRMHRPHDAAPFMCRSMPPLLRVRAAGGILRYAHQHATRGQLL